MTTLPVPPLLTSLTRIADFAQVPYDLTPLPRSAWAGGDYVAGEVVSSAWNRLELVSGREMVPVTGDRVIGAFGIRAATLEAVGSWEDIGDDGVLDAMTAAGLFGRITSKSRFLGSTMRLRYLGHLTRGERKLTMESFVRPPETPTAFDCPIVLIIGTSMSSGKTASGRLIVRCLTEAGLRVAGAKLTGAGRYRDILAYQDSGAAAIFDFVDSGLPSTVCPADRYRAALDTLLSRIAAEKPDVVVAEAGASPLEPYNGDTAVERIRSHVRFTVLCASDPYAVVGVTRGFGFDPDLVSGVATSTSAGCDVVRKIAGLPALNLLDIENSSELRDRLRERIGF